VSCATGCLPARNEGGWEEAARAFTTYRNTHLAHAALLPGRTRTPLGIIRAGGAGARNHKLNALLYNLARGLAFRYAAARSAAVRSTDWLLRRCLPRGSGSGACLCASCRHTRTTVDATAAAARMQAERHERATASVRFAYPSALRDTPPPLFSLRAHAFLPKTHFTGHENFCRCTTSHHLTPLPPPSTFWDHGTCLAP